MTLNIIAAVTRDMALGRSGDLLYHISADLKRFKELTMGYPVIMGRKTFESFPRGPLPGRRNIVVSRNPGYSHEGVEVYGTLGEAIAAVAHSERAFVIGGGQIYSQAISQADNIYLTIIEADCPDADTFFPEILDGPWDKRQESEPAIDPKSGVSYRYVWLSRR